MASGSTGADVCPPCTSRATDVSASANELETSSRQTVQVASQLAELGRRLMRIVQARREEPRAA